MIAVNARHAPNCEAAIDFDTAQMILAAEAQPLGRENVSIAEASGRRLAAEVRARVDAPRFDSAAMDGYAILDDDFASNRRDFICVDRVWAGGTASRPLMPGETVRVMTGAPVPCNASRVVMIERCRVRGQSVRIDYGQTEKPHVRPRGSDFRLGDVLLEGGHVLTPAPLVTAAAADHARLTVWKRPRVLIVATGDELVAPGDAAGTANNLPDSLSAAIGAMAKEFGADVVGSFRVGDTPKSILDVCRRTPADVIVLLGGASRGDRDFARGALLPIGIEICFADIAMKPGKPLWYGRAGAAHVLGLPGNPTAAFTTARLFLAPLLTGLAGGSPHDALNWRVIPTSGPMAANGNREGFYCGFATASGIALIGRQEASSQFTLARTNALLRRPALARAALEGETVQALLF